MGGDTDFDVAVLGAGISGVAALKCVLEDNLSAVCFEATDTVGGLWAYHPERYGAMSFTHINVSKQNYCFSDFPFPDDVPDYPRHDHMARYVKDYCEHFDLNRHIRFNTRIISVQCVGDMFSSDEASKRWRVVVQGPEGKKEVLVKGVLVCTGHHQRPVDPSWPGLESFKGPVFHAVKYKNSMTPVDLTKKRVLVIGVGNSACDIAVNSTFNAQEVYLSTRSGARPVPNYLFGFPTDWYVTRGLLAMPIKVTGRIFEKIVDVIYGDPHKFGLRPKMRLWQAQPTVNSFLLTHIARGSIKMRGDIERFDATHVYYKDGTKEEVDVVIKGTGYSIDLSVLDPKIQETVFDEKEHVLTLFKNAFSEKIGPSLGFIGFVQPSTGGILSVSEVQARWYCQLFKGKIKLPSKQVMRETMKKDLEEVFSRFFKSKRHTLQVDPIAYCDTVTSYFGANPSILSSPGLFWRILFSTGSPAFWRLRGPGAKPECKKIAAKAPIVPMSSFMGILGLVFFPITFLLLLIRLFRR